MVREVLITGATGTLGRKLVGAATAAGHHVRAMSRRSHVGYTGVHWSQGDLLANTGIDAAVEGVDVVVHCATQGTADKDVRSTENLLTAARKAGVGHIIYVSIVGIDRIPLPYYKTKLRVEQTLKASGVGHTVLRATQFHDLIKMTFAIQRFSREDQYLSEGLWHVQRRNEAWEKGDLGAAWRENLILERFFAPVLDVPTYASATAQRWPPEQHTEAASRPGVDRRPAAQTEYRWPLYVFR